VKEKDTPWLTVETNGPRPRNEGHRSAQKKRPVGVLPFASFSGEGCYVAAPFVTCGDAVRGFAEPARGRIRPDEEVTSADTVAVITKVRPVAWRIGAPFKNASRRSPRSRRLSGCTVGAGHGSDRSSQGKAAS